MAKSQLTVGIRIDGVRETLAAFRALPREAAGELRDTSLELSRKLAVSAQAAGIAEGHQAALVAKTVRAVRDRVPAVVAGGARRLGPRKAPAWKLLFGAEFGSNEYRQFPRLHVGRSGIWFFPTIEREATATAREWRAAADRIIRAFGKGT